MSEDEKDEWFSKGYSSYTSLGDITPPENATQEQKHEWYEGWQQAVRDSYEFHDDYGASL
jgi:ribosome modulation factor